MMPVPSTFEDLVEKATGAQLYQQLIRQLNKDLLFANIALEFEEDILPTSLKFMLFQTIQTLIRDRFMDYLNLLYIVDVPEDKVKALNGNDPVQLSEDVTFLILKREWQKVWFKNRL